jgi:8-oxo-dGTP diphosphatase
MTEEIKRPKVGLGVILMNYDTQKVLLGKRINSHGDKTMSFPGGHLEFYETLCKCGARELEEETGLIENENYRFMDKNSIRTTNDVFHDENKHYITLFLRARYFNGEPKNMEPEKCEGWRWYNWNQVKEFDNLFLPIRNLIAQNYDPFE